MDLPGTQTAASVTNSTIGSGPQGVPWLFFVAIGVSVVSFTLVLFACVLYYTHRRRRTKLLQARAIAVGLAEKDVPRSTGLIDSFRHWVRFKHKGLQQEQQEAREPRKLEDSGPAQEMNPATPAREKSTSFHVPEVDVPAGAQESPSRSWTVTDATRPSQAFELGRGVRSDTTTVVSI